jgi:hypothetical protein
MKKSIYQQQLDEMHGIQDDEKISKKKKHKKEKHSKLGEVSNSQKGVLERFNDQQAKGNIQNTLLKTVADIAGVGIGTVLSAASGKVASALGIALIGTGHYIGDNSGLMRIVGASTFAHSIAKAKEYRDNANQPLMDRLSELKDDWLIATLLKHYEEPQKKDFISRIPDTASDSSIEPVAFSGITKQEEDELQLEYGEQRNEPLDFSELEKFEQFNEDSAEDFNESKEESIEEPFDYSKEFLPDDEFPEELDYSDF